MESGHTMKKHFAVLGLGRFGFNLAVRLSEKGYSVLALDKEEKKVQECVGIVAVARVVDCTDPESLREAGVGNVDTAIVAIGSALEASILAVMAAKRLHVPVVIAKARNEVHSQILSRVGADQVVCPEKDMAIRLADHLTTTNLLEVIALSSDYNLVEQVAPSRVVGKTLGELRLRQTAGVSVVAIKHNDSVTAGPNGDDRIEEGDILVVIGEIAKVNAFAR